MNLDSFLFSHLKRSDRGFDVHFVEFAELSAESGYLLIRAFDNYANRANPRFLVRYAHSTYDYVAERGKQVLYSQSRLLVFFKYDTYYAYSLHKTPLSIRGKKKLRKNAEYKSKY